MKGVFAILRHVGPVPCVSFAPASATVTESFPNRMARLLNIATGSYLGQTNGVDSLKAALLVTQQGALPPSELCKRVKV
jgi:hypothetical protein